MGLEWQVGPTGFPSCAQAGAAWTWLWRAHDRAERVNVPMRVAGVEV